MRTCLLRLSQHGRLLPIALICLTFYGGCIFPRGQRYRHFTTPTPLPRGQILILGFMGGREPWNNDERSVRKLALKLRSMNDPEIHIETVENKKRALAIELINNAGIQGCPHQDGV